MRDAFGVDRISKIAMRPVYHGTTTEGATKLMRFIRAKNTSRSAFKPYDVPGDPRPRGLFTSPDRSVSESYSAAGRDGGYRRKKGKVLMFDSVGVKPKYKNNMEEIYDPKDLGEPLSTSNYGRTTATKSAVAASERAKAPVDPRVL